MGSLLHLLAADAPMPFAEPGIDPHYAPDRAVRIEHIDLFLSLFPEERRFVGRATLTVRPLACYGGSFAFDLDEVRVTSVTDGSGAPLEHVYGDGQLRILAATAPEQVKVAWEGANPARGLFFTGPVAHAPHRQPSAWTQCQDEDGHFVFPCHDHPGAKHSWALEVEGPAGYTLLSNGAEAERGSRADGRVWARFAMPEPMPAYLVTLVAAMLSCVEDEAVDGRPVRYYVPVGEEENTVRSFGRTPAMIRFLQDRLGVAYPWPRYDQVVVHEFIFGGMENVACTTMADILLVDEKAELEWSPDSLVVHELAHQWFGDLVTCQDWSQGWLNESWATYVEAMWWEHVHDEAEATWYRHQTALGYHAEASGRYRRPIVSYDFREPIDVFDRHLYNKGSCVLWTLRGELGTEPFFGAVKAYLEANAHGTVHTRDFQRALEQHTGRNLDGFFHQWIHGAGHPVVEVKLGKGEGLATVTVKQKQEGDDVAPAFRFQLHLEVVHTDGRITPFVLPIAERERTWALPVSDVKTVRVDPGYRVLAEITLKGPESWLLPLLADPCPVLASRAAEALVDDGGITAIDAVRRAAGEHPFGPVRGGMVKLLAKRNTAADRDLAIAVLADDPEPRARRMAAEALGASQDEEAATALLAALGTDLPTWQLQGAVLVSLGQTRDPRAVQALKAHLATASWVDIIRQRALAGLGHTRDLDVLPTLLEASSSGTPRAQSAAAAAMASLVEHHPDARAQVRERLEAMLSTGGFRVRNAAISALGSLQDPASLGALGRVHRSDPDGRTRRMAYEAMVKVRKGRDAGAAMGALQRRLDALADENATLRERVDKLERTGAQGS